MIRFIVAFLVFMIVFIIMFRFLPSDNFKTREILPGALLASIGWLVLSFLFSMYFDNFTIYNIMYGGLTSILLTLLWLYFCMMILLSVRKLINIFWNPENMSVSSAGINQNKRKNLNKNEANRRRSTYCRLCGFFFSYSTKCFGIPFS